MAKIIENPLFPDEFGSAAAPVDPSVPLSIEQAYKLLGVSRRTLYNYGKKGLLRIDHDHDGKPFVLRGQVDLVLKKKSDKVRKTEYVPDGCVVVKEDSYNAAHQRLTFLEQKFREMPKLLEQIDVDQARIAELEAERQALAEKLESVKSRGLFARLFNKEVE